MNTEQILEKIDSVITNIKNLNFTGSDAPNIDIAQIMMCNVQVAEIMAECMKQNLFEHIGERVYECQIAVREIDIAWDTPHHPFFLQKEIIDFYSAFKLHQILGTYEIPEDETMKERKKDLLCRSMNAAFSAWLGQDVKGELNNIKESLETYKAGGNQQFVLEIEAMNNMNCKNLANEGKQKQKIKR